MTFDIFSQVNWVDLVVIIIVIRICSIAIQEGFPVELFKVLGALFSTYLSLHYYTYLSDRFSDFFTKKAAPLEFSDFLAFLILAFLGYFVFSCLRMIFYRFMKMEAVPALSRWGGFILGIGRSFLLTGLVMFGLFISSVAYLKTCVSESYMGKKLLVVSPVTYDWLWNNLASRFLPKERINATVAEVKRSFPVK